MINAAHGCILNRSGSIFVSSFYLQFNAAPWSKTKEQTIFPPDNAEPVLIITRIYSFEIGKRGYANFTKSKITKIV